jgi:hypothetical protein
MPTTGNREVAAADFPAAADAAPREGVGEVFRLDGLRANRAFLEELLLKEDLLQCYSGKGLRALAQIAWGLTRRQDLEL